MRLLVTRPVEDADALAEKLQGQGHQVVRQPLLSIRFREAAPLYVPGMQGFLVTSANGARALGRFADLWDGVAGVVPFSAIPVVAVGPASAEAARAAGFSQVHEAGGDVAALADKVAAVCQPSGGPLVHVSGQAVAGDLQGILSARGFAVDRVIAYEAVAATAFEAAVEDKLRAGALDGVLFYSARTARIFRQLASQAGFDDSFKGMTAFCLSAAVAAALEGAGFGRVRVAARPMEQAMLDLLAVVR